MKTLLSLRLALVFGLSTVAGLLSGCISTGGYYGGDAGVDYYEDYGVEYGGWGPTYYVAPFRHEDHHRSEEFHRGGERHEAPEGGHFGRAFRSAPASHPIPSIPSRPRFGGRRSHTGPARK